MIGCERMNVCLSSRGRSDVACLKNLHAQTPRMLLGQVIAETSGEARRAPREWLIYINGRKFDIVDSVVVVAAAQ
jgi:hypothetical protein